MKAASCCELRNIAYASVLDFFSKMKVIDGALKTGKSCYACVRSFLNWKEDFFNFRPVTPGQEVCRVI